MREGEEVVLTEVLLGPLAEFFKANVVGKPCNYCAVVSIAQDLTSMLIFVLRRSI
jgi:hypothetical protein